jgi:general secretion pathway protein D
MLYSPDPKAQAHSAELGEPSEATSSNANLPSSQKANQTSMRRGFSPSFVSKRTARTLLLAALPVTLGASVATAQSAGTWNKRGQAAEVREDYDAAYVAYKNAHDKKPDDLRYRAHFERMRFLASTQHITRGRLLREQGDYPGALAQFMRAAEIDPSMQAAQQEIGITQRDQPPAGVSGPAAAALLEENSQQHKVQQEISTLAGPVQLKTVSSETYTLHMVEDTKVIYEAIGKQAGLNVIFDPDYTSKRIPVDLTNVTLADALRIVGTLSGTFYKPVTANTIFVAQSTRTKHTDLDDMAVQTFYLSNSATANDGNEILTGLRLLLDPSTKLYLVPSQNAIVMRSTVDQLLLAEKLINDFDRARPEVVIDVAVLEVNRDKIRNLGITLPTSIGLSPQIPTSSTTTVGTTTSATSTSSLTLNNLDHLNATDFAVNISGGTVNALLSDTDTRVLQSPRIRATDGQRATLKIGQKIPVATGSYNAGVSTGVASIGVQTQFTYLDVGVSIDITPTVHLDREISLKTSIEVSQQNGSQTISGVTEPIIGQRKLENVIQLKEGEPSILAGILTKQDNKSVAGTPGLGEIPFFKFFFSSQNKEVQDDEIVFLLIPHIVRENVLSRINQEAIDTGTSQDIAVRRLTSAAAIESDAASLTPYGQSAYRPVPNQTTIVDAANAAQQQLHQQGALPYIPPGALAAGQIPPGPPTIPPAGRVVSGAPVTLSVQGPATAQSVGSTFQVAIMLGNGRDISSVPLQMQFNPSVLQLVNVDTGSFLQKDGKLAVVVHRDEGNGLVSMTASRPPGVNGVSGSGDVATFTFKAVAPGDSKLSLTRVGATDALRNSLPATGSDASVHVK